MEKSKILELLKKNVQTELDEIEQAYNSTKGHATEPDMKAESKYDTRSVEASYLAGAQAKRVEELKLELKLLEEINTRTLGNDDDVSTGAIIELEFNGSARKYFLSNTAGGTILDIDGVSILVISVFSPIGSEVLGLSCGDSFELETPSGVREYKILNIN